MPTHIPPIKIDPPSKQNHDTTSPIKPPNLDLLQYEMPNNQSVNHDLGTRIQALALAEQGIAVKIVEAITQMSHQSIYRLKKPARERDYNSEISQQLKLEYVTDKLRSDCPLTVTFVIEQTILKTVASR